MFCRRRENRKERTKRAVRERTSKNILQKIMPKETKKEGRENAYLCGRLQPNRSMREAIETLEAQRERSNGLQS